MKYKNTAIAIIIVIILVGAFLVGINKAKNSNKINIVPSPSASPFSNWSTFKNDYQISIPANWQNTSDVNGQATIEPSKNGVKIGSMKKIVITSGQMDNQNKDFTTQEEFDSWRNKNKAQLSNGPIQKLDNAAMDGAPAVLMADTSSKNSWSVVAWTRNKDVNYYVNATGSGRITPDDLKAFDYLISTFKFPQI